jgi:putative sigma-54 modulation protein
MRLQVKGKNLEISDSIRTYAEQKLRKLDKQLGDMVQVELELTVEKNPSIRENQVAEATVFTKGHSLRVREATNDMRASIDGLTDKLLREVKEYRDKRVREPRRHADHNGVAPPAERRQEDLEA